MTKFMEGLHNTVKEVLPGFATNTRVALENLQQQINFDVNNSMEVYTKCTLKVTDYCFLKTKQ